MWRTGRGTSLSPNCSESRLVRPIRVLLGPLPQMLREILLETFAHQPDMLVVGEPSVGPLHEAVRLHGPHAVVVGMEGHDWAERHVELFRERPRLRLLVIRSDGRSAAMHELRIVRCPVEELSPEAVVAAVRRSCAPLAEGEDAPTAPGRG